MERGTATVVANASLVADTATQPRRDGRASPAPRRWHHRGPCVAGCPAAGRRSRAPPRRARRPGSPASAPADPFASRGRQRSVTHASGDATSGSGIDGVTRSRRAKPFAVTRTCDARDVVRVARAWAGCAEESTRSAGSVAGWRRARVPSSRRTSFVSGCLKDRGRAARVGYTEVATQASSSEKSRTRPSGPDYRLVASGHYPSPAGVGPVVQRGERPEGRL